MKKTKILLSALLVLIVLTGCSSGDADIQDRDEVLVQIGDKAYTSGQLYDVIKYSSAVEYLQKIVDNELIDNEIEKTEELEKEAKESLKTIKELLDDNWEDYIKQNGFETEEDFYNERILPSVYMGALSVKYVSENLETVATTYSPYKVEIFQGSDLEKANKAYKQIKEGASVKDMAKKYGVVTTFDGTTQLINSAYGLPTELYTAINALEKNGDVTEVYIDSTNSKYYIVKMVEIDYNEFKDEAIDSLASIQAVSQETITKYLEKYKFDIYDQQIFEQFDYNLSNYVK